MNDYHYLTKAEAAAALGGTEADVDALVAARNLTPVQMSEGGAVLFRPSQVKAAATLAKAKGVTLEDLKAMSAQEVANLPAGVVAAVFAVPQVPDVMLTDPGVDEVTAAVAGTAAARAKVQQVTADELRQMTPQDVARLSPETVTRALAVKQIGVGR